MSGVPEKDALMHYLMRNESIRHLETELCERGKITQEFLKSALQTIVFAFMDMEHKQSMALVKLEELAAHIAEAGRQSDWCLNASGEMNAMVNEVLQMIKPA